MSSFSVQAFLQHSSTMYCLLPLVDGSSNALARCREIQGHLPYRAMSSSYTELYDKDFFTEFANVSSHSTARVSANFLPQKCCGSPDCPLAVFNAKINTDMVTNNLKLRPFILNWCSRCREVKCRLDDKSSNVAYSEKLTSFKGGPEISIHVI